MDKSEILERLGAVMDNGDIFGTQSETDIADLMEEIEKSIKNTQQLTTESSK